MIFFKKILTPPVFEDEVKTQQAYMLHIILWTLVIIPIPYLIFSIFVTSDNMARVYIQVGFGVRNGCSNFQAVADNTRVI